MARRIRYAQIKNHRSYEVEELAICVGVTTQTVRAWIKGGMPALTDKRPYLIVGQEAKTYLKAREAARKAKCGDGDFFCLGCKAWRKAALGMTDVVVQPNGRRTLSGFCEVCERPCNRFLPDLVTV